MEACLAEIQTLKEKLKDQKLTLVDDGKNILSIAAGKSSEPGLTMKPKKKLDGHFGKIYAFAWGPDSINLVSASQDGNMFVWNAIYGLKTQGINLKSSWVMACGYSPNGEFVSTAGLDNVVWIYKVQQGSTEDIHTELAGHEGYISTCTWINDRQMLTTSGDCSAGLWDIETKRMVSEFTEHNMDVNCAAVSSDSKMFLTGSCDSSVKVWDIRTGNKAIRTFIGHDSDVNALSWFPDNQCFLSGSDDSTCRLFDIRSYGMLNLYSEEKHFAGVTGASVSKSGKYIFTSYDSGPVFAWNTLTGKVLQKLDAHEKRVSRAQLSPNGIALCTASWDATMILWIHEGIAKTK